MKTKLYGVGVGPGDPELLTLKAKRIINSVDVLLCPSKSEEANSFAFEIIEPNLENKEVIIDKMIFPMHYNVDEIEKKWKMHGDRITEYLKEGKTCAFITLGDPTVYSTFMYTLPYIEKEYLDLEIIPGITSFCAVSADVNQPLMLWEESLKVVPVRKHDGDHLYREIKDSDNIILMKPSNNAEGIVKALKDLNLENKFMLISKVSTDSAHLIKDINELENTKIPYLSTMLIKKGGFHE